MGLFDNISKAFANPSKPVPNPLNQSRDNFFTGYGNGQLVSLLRRALPGSHKDWSQIAGDLGLNSVLAVGIDWYIRNFPQATVQVVRPLPDSAVEVINDHPLLGVLREPMPNVAGTLVWGWVIQDYKLFGNAYLRKIRTGQRGEVIGLQYLPQDMVRPIGNGTDPLTHYNYTTDGRQYSIMPEDMVHIRYGRDPMDIRIGRAPVQAVLREVAADNVASATAYAMLANGGIPSMIVGPDSNNLADNISMDDAKTLKRQIRENLTGDNAGGVVVMTGAYKMDKVSYSPSDMALDSVRRVPEERICAALGLNPMVLGLGAGLERSTYNNYQAAQQAAWEDGMIPTLGAIADALTIQLLPDFANGTEDYKVQYNYDDVRALADDYDAMATRADKLYRAGIIDRATAKRLVGVEPDDDDTGKLYNDSTGGASLGETANAAGILIRSGYNPASVTEFLGLPVQHTGAAPVTLRDETKASTVKYTPNEGMQAAARRALAWKDEGHAGGTRVGLARANQIVNGETLSEDTVLRMYSFFARHEVDKQATGFNSGEDGYPSAGRVAWDLWGGDAGFTWARTMRNKIIDDREEKSFDAGECCDDHGPAVPYFSDPFYGLDILYADE